MSAHPFTTSDVYSEDARCSRCGCTRAAAVHGGVNTGSMSWWHVLVFRGDETISYAVEAEDETGAAFAGGAEFAQEEGIPGSWHHLQVTVECMPPGWVPPAAVFTGSE